MKASSIFPGVDAQFEELRLLLVDDHGVSRLQRIERRLGLMSDKLDLILNRLDHAMTKVDDAAAQVAANTAAINKMAEAITGMSEGHATIAGEIAALKDAVATANVPVDFTALDSAVAEQSAAISRAAALVPAVPGTTG